MPFHIERVYLESEAINDTERKYMQICTLVEGNEVTIECVDDPSKKTTIERLQACILPAGLGKHRYVHTGTGHALVVIIRMKKG